MLLWFFQHQRAPLLLAWGLGAALCLLHPARRRAGALPFLALLGLGLLALGSARPLGLEALVDLHGVRPAAQWLGLAALLLLCPPATRPAIPGVRSLLPLPLLGLLGVGSGGLLTAVLIAGRGLLEPGQPRRRVLLATLALLAGAEVVDVYSLPLWLGVRRLGLHHDTASLVVDGTASALGLCGWLVAGFLAGGEKSGDFEAGGETAPEGPP